MDIANGFVAEIAPTEPDGVYSGVGYGIAAGFDVGRYIFVDERTSLYHHMCADVAELMNEAPAANHSVVVDNYFSGHLRSVRYNDVISDNTVVGDV